MKGHDFKRWRKSLELSQKEAADALGLKRRVVQYYEKGERDGDPVKIPRTVRLACYAIMIGVEDYQGPEKEKKKDKERDKDRDRESLADGGEGEDKKRDKKDKKKKKKKKDRSE
jgi:transcriptional regulator with XRE-family HTH domain